MLKLEELKSKSQEELQAMVLDLKKEAFNLRFQRVSGSLQNTNRFKEVRRTVARIYTLLNETKNSKTAIKTKAEAKPKKEVVKKKPKKEAK